MPDLEAGRPGRRAEAPDQKQRSISRIQIAQRPGRHAAGGREKPAAENWRPIGSCCADLLTRPQATTQDALLAILASFQKGEIDPAQLSVTLTNQLSKEDNGSSGKTRHSREGLLPRGLVGSYDALMAFIHQQADAGKLRQHLSSLLETMAQLQQMKSACEGALAKITSQQLTPLTRESEQPLLLFDLHFRTDPPII